eukprot:2189695-Prorocentrum_lima.AAC.1
MTSSLVGSEMCIRDSFGGAQLDALRWRSNTFARAQPLSWPLSGNRAVSYTHLTLPTICSV